MKRNSLTDGAQATNPEPKPEPTLAEKLQEQIQANHARALEYEKTGDLQKAHYDGIAQGFRLQAAELQKLLDTPPATT